MMNQGMVFLSRAVAMIGISYAGGVFDAVGQVSQRNTTYTAEKGKDEMVLKTPDGIPMLAYRYTVKRAPQDVDAAYGRAGYIHPLYTPSGHVLTHIQPKDHYHHYGLWNPWTKVEYNGTLYDLWNIGDKKGTVRFSRFSDTFQDAANAGFEAIHHHVVFDGGGETTIMTENWRIEGRQLDARRFQVDIRSDLAPATDNDVILKEYRYGGLGFRATAEWTNRNSEVLTSSGKTRKDADGSLERWAMVFGQLGGGEGGVLFLSHPTNENAPEPVRVWPEDGNGGRGDQFFNFSPTKNRDWVLRPAHTYTLRYRLIVFDGTLSAGEADRLWTDYASQ